MTMKMINLGCGQHFHDDWVNLDSFPQGKGVIRHNLINGIPFDNNMFDVVYHSHILEHFSRKDGIQFIKECFRILKKNGIIRIAIPDLEKIAKNYLHFLEHAIQGDLMAGHNYHWTMLEMYDQTVRNHPQGDMGFYLKQKEMPNAEFVKSRIGVELKDFQANNTQKQVIDKFPVAKYFSVKRYLNRLKMMLLSNNEKKAMQIGQFFFSSIQFPADQFFKFN